MIAIPTVVEKHSVGPAVNIEGIIRDLGIELNKKADLREDISGQIERLSDGKYKISVNGKEWYYRQRFTMAHELGHFVLHRDRLNEGTSDGIAFRTVPGNGLDNPQIGQIQEAQANAFAAEILMPVHLVKSAMESASKDTKVAAKKLQTSEAALKIRLEALRRSGEPI